MIWPTTTATTNITKRCQMVVKDLPRFEYGFDPLSMGCPNHAKHSIIRRVKRNDVLTEEKQTVRLCDENFHEAKSQYAKDQRYFGDPNPEFI